MCGVLVSQVGMGRVLFYLVGSLCGSNMTYSLDREVRQPQNNSLIAFDQFPELFRAILKDIDNRLYCPVIR